jgi:serine/threonine protein kinase
MIPRCYGAVVVSPPDTPHQDVAETLVYGIIIENIDAAPLPSVDPSSHDFSSLGHSLMAAVYSFSLHGVIHNDMRSDNILISPDRIVLIDFGQAILRGDIEDDEHWAEKVELEEEVEALRRILHRREIRDCTPYIPAKLFRGFYHFNHTVSIQRESWRKRWYDKVVGSVPEIFDDEDESEQPAWWTLKKEVQAWLTSRPHPPESFKVPRPGSPDYVKGLSVAQLSTGN